MFDGFMGHFILCFNVTSKWIVFLEFCNCVENHPGVYVLHEVMSGAMYSPNYLKF
jgi:hypothetical protein